MNVARVLPGQVHVQQCTHIFTLIFIVVIDHMKIKETNIKRI